MVVVVVIINICVQISGLMSYHHLYYCSYLCYSFNHSGLHQVYIEHNISMYRWKQKSQRGKPKNCYILSVCLYVKGISEKILIYVPYNIRTTFGSNSTLQRNFCRIKPNLDITKDCMYSIPYSCGKENEDKSRWPLKVRLKEHQKACSEGVRQWNWAWREKCSHQPLWDETKILNKKNPGELDIWKNQYIWGPPY